MFWKIANKVSVVVKNAKWKFFHFNCGMNKIQGFFAQKEKKFRFALRSGSLYIEILREFYNKVWWIFARIHTAWKVSKYGIFSGPYVPVFGLNTKIYSVNLRIQSEYSKIQTRKNSVLGHFSSSVLRRLRCT